MTEAIVPIQLGSWNVIFQPGLDENKAQSVKRGLTEFQTNYFTESRFNLLKARGLACFQAIHCFAPNLQYVFNPAFTVKEDTWISFKDKVRATTGDPQTGQNVLEIDTGDGISIIVDLACYLFDIPYSKVPVAVGDAPTLERALSEQYTDALGKDIAISILKLPKKA